MYGWNQFFCSFKLLPLLSKTILFQQKKKAEGLKLNSTVYTFLSLEPNGGTGFKKSKCKWHCILPLTCIQKLYKGIDRFAKSCVATHISEDMDRLTDCVGQCTICRSIPSDFLALFAPGVRVQMLNK